MKENILLVDDDLTNFTINIEENIEEQTNDFINKYNLK